MFAMAMFKGITVSDSGKPHYETCSVHRTLHILSDPWSFLILRELWFGLRRFDEFQTTLNIPRATLSNRLKNLLVKELLVQRPAKEGGARKVYRLTERGSALYPVMLTLLRWGDVWRKGDDGVPLYLKHNCCNKKTEVEVIYSCCGGRVDPKQVVYSDGPGVGVEPLDGVGKTNRTSKPEKFTESRTCSVASTLQVMGDRWTFLLIRELFFGRHRFDVIQKQVGVATNILSNRIKLLIDSGIIEKSSYGKGTTWFEYHLTPAGLDLYPSFLAMIAWGDRWQAGSRGAPLLLTHNKCGQKFEPLVVCKHCKEPVDAHDMTYKPGPGWSVKYGEDLLLQNMPVY